ncbi:MAG: AraC family transcriptional regulator [Draconibacterium sp.]|nr:AraC family transcriptional regulator [Draconibacterium sp.]
MNWLHFICESVFIKQLLQDLPVVTELSFKEVQKHAMMFNHLDSFFKIFLKNLFKNEINRISDYLRIQASVLSFISEVVNKSDNLLAKSNQPGNRLQNAIEYINLNFKKNIRLKDLAEICYMSENYFHSQFTSVFGITPNKYILQLRMNEAVALLMNTKLSINEIAQETGYFDAAYFSRVFSKYFQLSPLQYRNSLETRIP